MTREIQLTKGKVSLVDDEDFERLNTFKWHTNQTKNNLYALREIWVNGKGKKIYMHRLILNAPNNLQVDHINGDGLDNRKKNLRICTQQQNLRNRQYQKNNKLRVKGVRWYEKRKKFSAQIRANGKAIHLGYFSVLNEADSAYRQAEEKYFGGFARGKTLCQN